MNWLMNTLMFQNYISKPEREFNYLITTELHNYNLGKVRIKIVTDKEEHFRLTILGIYNPTKVRSISKLDNIILDAADIHTFLTDDPDYYNIPEAYQIQSAEERLRIMLSDKEHEYILTDDNMYLNINLNPISKVYILGTDDHIVSLPIFKQLVRTTDEY